MAEKTAELRIARDLALPLDAVTQAIAILARRGAGKTYTATVLVEEVIGAGAPVVVLDPTGAWWGLRSSADGTKPGQPVVIFGGDHGDVTLERTTGATFADVVLEHPAAYVVDLSAFESKAAEQRFAADFLERLYRAKRPEGGTLLVVVDEADTFAPQQPRDRGDQLRTLGALESIVRRGRIKGLGSLLITQRAAVLNKNVLEQTEILVAMQTTGPRDRAAIDSWIEGHGTREERDEVLGSLASLERGEAWVWSPSFLRILQRVRIRERRTYDSSRTPAAGETRIVPRAFAQVDLERLGERIRAAAEEQKANDPAELRRRIRQLEAESAARLGVIERRSEPEVREVRIEVPVLNGQVERLQAVAVTLGHVGTEIAKVGADIIAAIALVEAPQRPRTAAAAPVAPMPARPASAPARPAAQLPVVASDGPERPLGRAERSLLNVLASFPEGRTRIQLSILSGYSIKSSSFANALGALRSAGLAEGRDPITITEAGRDAAGEITPVPTGAALLDHWRGQIGKAERALLDVLVDAWPDELTREELSERSGYSITSSSFANAIGRLRSLQLVNGLRASDDLFEGQA